MKERNMLSIAPRTPYYFCTALLLCILSGNVFAGKTTLISVASIGVQENSDSSYPSFSADSRYVAFWSAASNLVIGDTNNLPDVFVRDRLTKQTTRVSVNSNGEQGVGYSGFDALSVVSLSANGRYVAFSSIASNLVTGDSNGTYDIFVHDRATQKTTRISVTSNGEEGNGDSRDPSLSADGRYVAFTSWANNMVTGDTNGYGDTFVHDRLTNKTTRVSVDSSGMQGNGYSIHAPSISADGRYVAFESIASNLVAGGDSNGSYSDIFVYDRLTLKTTRVNVASNGIQANVGDSSNPSISADGRYVAFDSTASTLVAGDTNGNRDIFVHDRTTGQTTRVSVDSGGTQGNYASAYTSLSADGRFVAFQSVANNLVTGDSNSFWDTFIHNRLTHKTTRVSVDSNGTAGSGGSWLSPSLSADGRNVAFMSNSRLVANDTHGSNIFVRDRLHDPIHHADLKIETTQKPAALAPNSNGAYVYTITNNGPDAVNNVDITHLVMSGGAGLVVNFTPSQGSCTNYATLNLCRLGNLLAGKSLTLQADVKAAGNPLVQKVTVKGEPVDAVPTNNLVSVSTTVTP